MLGDMLWLARKDVGLRQVDAAAHVHITQPYLSMIEHNVSTPSPPILQRLLRLYGVSIAPEDGEQGCARAARRRPHGAV
jgi:transcriptional regulator with XRE-family HTH domain